MSAEAPPPTSADNAVGARGDEERVSDLFESALLGSSITKEAELVMGSVHALAARVKARTSPGSAPVTHSGKGGQDLSGDELGQLSSILQRVKLVQMVFKAHTQAEKEVMCPAIRAVSAVEAGQVADGIASDKDGADAEAGLAAIGEQLLQLRHAQLFQLDVPALCDSISRAADRVLAGVRSHMRRDSGTVVSFVTRHFSEEDARRIVGRMMGQRPTELIQMMLDVLSRTMEPGERKVMLRCMCDAARGTNFRTWLRDAVPDAFSGEGEGEGAERSAGDDAKGSAVPANDDQRLQDKAEEHVERALAAATAAVGSPAGGSAARASGAGRDRVPRPAVEARGTECCSSSEGQGSSNSRCCGTGGGCASSRPREPESQQVLVPPLTFGVSAPATAMSLPPPAPAPVRSAETSPTSVPGPATCIACPVVATCDSGSSRVRSALHRYEEAGVIPRDDCLSSADHTPEPGSVRSDGSPVSTQAVPAPYGGEGEVKIDSVRTRTRRARQRQQRKRARGATSLPGQAMLREVDAAVEDPNAPAQPELNLPPPVCDEFSVAARRAKALQEGPAAAGGKSCTGGSGGGARPELGDKCGSCGVADKCLVHRPLTQRELELAVRGAAQDESLSARDKAMVMQRLMTSRWRAAQRAREQAVRQKETQATARGSDKGEAMEAWRLAASKPGALEPAFADAAHTALGCPHYRRSCKLYAACCDRYVPCRQCHDAGADHALDRYTVSHMLCVHCGVPQRVGQHCHSTKCRGRRMARYYCETCHLLEDAERDVYHCPFCNVCRLGKGLGQDYYHCMQCNACVAMGVDHVCVERSLDRDCPICGEHLFSSVTPLKVMPCGHTLHRACFVEHARSSYTCPLCYKSVRDMTHYFKRLDAWVARHPMPPEFHGAASTILCNDCGQRSTVPYRFVHHKCAMCGSYNARVLDGPLRGAALTQGPHCRAVQPPPSANPPPAPAPRARGRVRARAPASAQCANSLHAPPQQQQQQQQAGHSPQRSTSLPRTLDHDMLESLPPLAAAFPHGAVICPGSSGGLDQPVAQAPPPPAPLDPPHALHAHSQGHAAHSGMQGPPPAPLPQAIARLRGIQGYSTATRAHGSGGGAPARKRRSTGPGLMPPPPPVAAAPHPAITYAPRPLPQAPAGTLPAAVSLAPRPATAPFPLGASGGPGSGRSSGSSADGASVAADWSGTVVGAAVESLPPFQPVTVQHQAGVGAGVPSGLGGDQAAAAMLDLDSPSRKRARPAGAGAGVSPLPLGAERARAEHKEKRSKTSPPPAPAIGAGAVEEQEGQSAPVWATQS